MELGILFCIANMKSLFYYMLSVFKEKLQNLLLLKIISLNVFKFEGYLYQK